jgi:hypothetical protein
MTNEEFLFLPWMTSVWRILWLICTTSNQSQSHIATDGQSISKSCCRAPSGAHDQIFITLWQLRICWCGALSLTRGRVCRLQLLLAFARAVILGPKSRRTWDYILLSHIRDSHFRRLLRLAGSRWRYSKPPPHGSTSNARINSLLWLHSVRIEITASNS